MMDTVRQSILTQVSSVVPFDNQESADKVNIMEWIQSDLPLFRTKKPATPPKHLVAYIALFDEKIRRVLLVDHLKAKTWLATGGHVLANEDPRDAAVRECREELGIAAKFWHQGKQPYFVTVTQTINESPTDTHTDVTLWYILEGTESMHLEWDTSEFTAVQWMDIRSIVDNPDYFLPLRRFCAKLLAL
jgi:8-oxo-dGTP diphosphatase